MTVDEVIKRLHESDRFVPIDTIEYGGRIIKLPFNVIEELIKGMMKGGDE